MDLIENLEPYTLVLIVLIIIGVTLILQKVRSKSSTSFTSSSEIEQAREDITDARQLLNELSIKLANGNSSSVKFDPEVISGIVNSRLTVFEAKMMTCFAEIDQSQANEVADAKSDLVHAQEDLKALQVTYQNKLNETEIEAKNQVALRQIKLEAIERTLVEQRASHEKALKATSSAYATALDAYRSENGKADEAVENYNEILSTKFDEFNREATIAKDLLKEENANLLIKLAQFKETNKELSKLKAEFDSYKITVESEKNKMTRDWGKEKEHFTKMLTETEAASKSIISDLENEKGSLISDIQQLQNDLKNAREQISEVAAKAAADATAAAAAKAAAAAAKAAAAAAKAAATDAKQNKEAKANTSQAKQSSKEKNAGVATMPLKETKKPSNNKTAAKSNEESIEMKRKKDQQATEEERKKQLLKTIDDTLQEINGAMNECKATELYQSVHGGETKKQAQGTVVKMTAAFAMQLLVDNALPYIDTLSEKVKNADDIEFKDNESFDLVKNGANILKQAKDMVTELETAVQEAHDKVRGEEAREEARAAAAARGMPNAIQWTAQNRKLAKELW
jgi:hypothetical protein